jgi:hypothetical protein
VGERENERQRSGARVGEVEVGETREDGCRCEKGNWLDEREWALEGEGKKRVRGCGWMRGSGH